MHIRIRIFSDPELGQRKEWRTVALHAADLDLLIGRSNIPFDLADVCMNISCRLTADSERVCATAW